MFKRLTFLSALALVLISTALFAEVKTLTIDVDREDQLYTCGAPAGFTITAKDENGELATSGTLSLCFQNDLRKVVSTREFDLSQQNPVKAEETLGVPGFLSLIAAADSARATAGCGFDVEKIQPAVPCPEDFDAYWADLKKQVRALPEDLTLEEIPNLCNEKQTIYRLKIRTLGEDKFVHGFLAVPKNQGEGPFPMIVNVPGAGPGCGPNLQDAQNGIIALNLNVFPYPVPLDEQEKNAKYNEFNQSLGIGYFASGATSRDTYFFRDVYAGIDRAIDVIAARPDVDKAKIIYQGTSQGGASGLILGGLSDRWLAIVSSVPALCDHGGAKLDRSPGWPKLCDMVKDPAVENVAPYFDGENFARHIHCPIRVTVGFIDGVCSPSSVYAAYNTIPATDKQILNETKLGHQNGAKFQEAIKWLYEKIQK